MSRFWVLLLAVLATASTAATTASNAFAADKETVLHGFQGGKDASYPQSNLFMDAAGNLYGETVLSGLQSCLCGTIFELSPMGNRWKKTTLHEFTGGTGGDYPSGGLIADAAGNLYGTTEAGGDLICGCGMVFELSPAGSRWKFRVIHNFVGGKDGELPYAGLVFDGAGNLYGTTGEGGGGPCKAFFSGCGTIYELSLNPDGSWKETILYSFTGGADGAFPDADLGLTFDNAGNLYGTTSSGGYLFANCGSSGCGTVFELSPIGGGQWTYNVIYSFLGGTDGSNSSAGLRTDGSGNLFGTTNFGGAPGYGTVFELKPLNGGGWTESVLYSFSGGKDGAYPLANLTLDSSGNLFGEVAQGGNLAACPQSAGCGTVFELSPSGQGWHFSLLVTFNGRNGAFPTGDLILDSLGNIYGATDGGGTGSNCLLSAVPGCGLVFELTPQTRRSLIPELQN